MAAPVVAIVAHDPKFYEELPRLFPHADARSWFAGNEELAAATAFRNGTLQGAYLIMAARAVGLDCGPMSGFDNARVDAEFLADTGWKSNFLVNIGHGDPAELFPRSPRLELRRGLPPAVARPTCRSSWRSMPRWPDAAPGWSTDGVVVAERLDPAGAGRRACRSMARDVLRAARAGASIWWR